MWWGEQVRGGSLAARSEVVLEVAAAHVEGLHVDGSLLVTATAPLGHMQAAALDATAPPRARPPPLCAPTSFDSLEGLFFDDSWALKEARSEYLTTSPPGEHPTHPAFQSRCSVHTAHLPAQLTRWSMQLKPGFLVQSAIMRET